MKKIVSFSFLAVFTVSSLSAQTTVTVFDDVPFYSMYHYLGEGETLPPEAYSQIPEGAIRLHAYERDIISRKLTESEVASLGNSLTMNVILMAACDNYDRLAGVNLALVPKGSTTYTWEQTDVKRIEIGRFITPFMNKNKTPTSVPYTYKVDNIAAIVHNPVLMANYDAWIEFRADGYSAAAQTQVQGCADRTDVFRGTLQLVSSGTANSSANFFLPISYRQNLNNYNSTDVPGETTRIVNFDLTEPVENAVLYLITSNHGANTGGEEYVRREHFVYLDNQLLHHYKPGGKSCEPYRQYNTQSNGIYGTTAKTLRNWLSWNNWCPGDAIPNREIKLGNLAAGQHTLKIDVPDAVFNGGEGYFPISMYIQNSASGQMICAAPTDLIITNQVNKKIDLAWTENGSSNQWDVLWGRKSSYSATYDFFQGINGEPKASRDDLTVNYFYEMYVQSKCTNDITSEWVGPTFSDKITLGTQENSIENISVYPNPAKDVINIRSSYGIKNVLLYSADGKKVSETDSSSINISQFPKGVYMMTIFFTNGKKSMQKIIKE